MNRYLGYVFGLIVIVPVGAFIAKHATAWIAGFRPRYSKALVSTIVAYAVVNVVGLALYGFGVRAGLSRGFQELAGWAILSCTHINLLRSDKGDSLSVGKAMIVALCQMFGAIAASLLILSCLLLIKRLLL